VKRFLILLVIAAGGLAWSALAVPTNAAVVNGVVISQGQVNTGVAAIAASPGYYCFLDAEALEGGLPQPGIPSPDGVGQASQGGAHTTSTSAFVASYLDTAIGHQLVYQLAARYHVHPSASDLATAHTALIDQVTGVTRQAASNQLTLPTQCAGAGSLTGAEVLKSMPASFVNEQVRFDATVSLLEEDVSGVGSTTADLHRYFVKHRATFNNVSFTLAGYQTEAAAQAARASVYEGASFATLAKTSGGGPQGTEILFELESQLPTAAHLQTLALNTVSAPISYNGGYLLIELTSETPVPFTVAELGVKSAVQNAGAVTAQALNTSAERKATVVLNPRYGAWSRADLQLLLAAEPSPSDVLNAAANTPPIAAVPPTATSSG
jgi:hypothetical protein